MPDIRPNRLIRFDHGIDTIVHTRGNERTAQDLPERRNLAPSDDPALAQLDQLLDKPNIQRFLEEALRPDISDRDLLMPSQFAEALREALKALARLAENGGDSRTLNRAVRLLKEETNLRELVAMYRGALYQG
ncbi:type III secretion apparatus assembly protein SctX [Castellaniella sp. WN]